VGSGLRDRCSNGYISVVNCRVRAIISRIAAEYRENFSGVCSSSSCYYTFGCRRRCSIRSRIYVVFCLMVMMPISALSVPQPASALADCQRMIWRVEKARRTATSGPAMRS